MKRLIISSLLLTSLYSKTYEIVEQDLISEIESKSELLSEKMEAHKKKIVKKIDNYTGEVLSKAPTSKVKFIDPTFTLDRDIPKYNRYGKKTGILYKKGYKFNPLEHINIIPPDMIVFNVCDKNESSFVNTLIQNYEKDKRDYLLVNSGCKNKDVKKTNFRKKVYFLTKEMIQKFKLKHTISVISVNKERKMIEVKEVRIDEKTIEKN